MVGVIIRLAALFASDLDSGYSLPFLRLPGMVIFEPNPNRAQTLRVFILSLLPHLAFSSAARASFLRLIDCYALLLLWRLRRLLWYSRRKRSHVTHSEKAIHFSRVTFDLLAQCPSEGIPMQCMKEDIGFRSFGCIVPIKNVSF